ncbi:MAG: hypothetical protein CVU61_10645 [Deltaproteobacteria bacterium HGW-Deltaproteobacteria-19]|nr:MAG: hypothetical protein CVU61_10645 [Deltaproteobacteria bacterium HGW-Deltaproteobacteria-19]
MTGMEFIARVFPYLALGLFVLGTAWRFLRWRSLPAHLKWTLYPFPKGTAGQLKYMAGEIFTFGTIYRFNRRLWIGAYVLHMAMGGFVLFSILYLAGWLPGTAVRIILWILLAAPVYLVALRSFNKYLRAVTTPEEFFNLIFLAAFAVAGLAASPSAMSPRAYFVGLMLMRPDAASLPPELVPAILLGGLFLIYLPWSRMIHYISKYFAYHAIKWQKN